LIKAASRKVNLQNVHHKREVNYSSDDHFAVLFQMYGSVWPKVFPWCVFISGLSAGIFYLRQEDIIDLTIQSNSGHGFISILVSFLVVTRTTITYSRFMEAREHLEDLFRVSRELVQYACAYTLVDKGQKAREWRQKVAYRTILTLRMAVAAAEFRGYGVNAWETIHEDEHVDTPLILPRNDDEDDDDEEDGDNNNNNNGNDKKKKKNTTSTDRRRHRESIGNYKPGRDTDHAYFLRELSHGPRSLTDENMRAPIVWVYNLRETLVEMRNDPNILPVHPMHVNECLKLNAFAGDLATAFHGLKKLITTPFPFPLVQMTRTFLFFWILSLPFVLVPNYSQLWEICFLMFFVTYGFLGLEYVNMELDDPHGRDPNDFPGQ
jgi:predicted membrane chloride channel (bestrophin family)